MRLPPAWFDGLEEARRGLWRSAEDSFAAAANRAPTDPRPPLARATCLLHLGRVDAALVLLETAPALRDDDPLFGGNIRWLRAVARLAAGDALGAEQAAEALPAAAQRQLAAVNLLQAGRYAAGVAALLEGHRAG